MGSVRRACAALLIVLMCVSSIVWADTAYLTGKKPITGEFIGYKKEFFLLKGEDGKTYRIRKQRLQKLELDEPKRMLFSAKGSSEEPEVILHGYQVPLFTIERGRGRERFQVHKINWLTLPSESPWAEKFKAAGKVISRGEEVDIQSLVTPGRITVVHFHATNSAQSVKMQAYLSRLYHMNPGGTAYLKVETTDWNAPVMAQYDVSRVPLVWIYDHSGRRIQELSGTVNPRDIDAAFEAAQRPGG